MVKYLLSNFSTNMVAEPHYIAFHKELTEDEFNELKADAVAIVSNPSFAHLLKTKPLEFFLAFLKVF